MRKYLTVANMEVHIGFVLSCVIIAMLSSALAMMYFTKTIDHQASIVTDGKVQTYLDAGCTQVLNSHSWGSFNVSSGDHVKTLDFYMRNEGNVRVNVTWTTLDFASYNETAIQYESSSWKLYLVKVDGGEIRIRPENATAPDKMSLTPRQTIHLKLYLTALDCSPPGDFDFQTSFNSKDD
jgi:hypothetical protein